MPNVPSWLARTLSLSPPEAAKTTLGVHAEHPASGSNPPIPSSSTPGGTQTDMKMPQLPEIKMQMPQIPGLGVPKEGSEGGVSRSDGGVSGSLLPGEGLKMPEIPEMKMDGLVNLAGAINQRLESLGKDKGGGGEMELTKLDALVAARKRAQLDAENNVY